MDERLTWSTASVQVSRSQAGLCACFSTPPSTPHPQYLARWLSRLLRVVLSVLYTELPSAAFTRPLRGTRASDPARGERGKGGEQRREPSPVTRNVAGLSLASWGSIAHRCDCKHRRTSPPTNGGARGAALRAGSDWIGLEAGQPGRGAAW